MRCASRLPAQMSSRMPFQIPCSTSCSTPDRYRCSRYPLWGILFQLVNGIVRARGQVQLAVTERIQRSRASLDHAAHRDTRQRLDARNLKDGHFLGHLTVQCAIGLVSRNGIRTVIIHDGRGCSHASKHFLRGIGLQTRAIVRGIMQSYDCNSRIAVIGAVIVWLLFSKDVHR